MRRGKALRKLMAERVELELKNRQIENFSTLNPVEQASIVEEVYSSLMEEEKSELLVFEVRMLGAQSAAAVCR